MSFDSISELRKSRGNISTLLDQVEKMSATTTTESKDDGKEWKISVDQTGNGSAVIRFLPAPKGEEMPWARIWTHGFQGPTGKWYIENSLTTLNQPDPVSELNTQLWNTGVEADKDTARKQKRRLSYYSNILVVSDPANPENEGKVFLFRYGKKIFDMIQDQLKPEFPNQDPVNPFDFWDGVDFALVARNVAGYRNYDKSKFANAPRPVSDSDEGIEAIWEQQYSLAEIVDPSQFKSYDELKTKLDTVLKGAAVSVSSQTDDLEDDAFVQTVTQKSEETVSTFNVNNAESVGSDDDDAMSYFAKLADDE